MENNFNELVSFKGGMRLADVELDKTAEQYIKLGERFRLEGHPIRAILLDLLTKYPDTFYIVEIVLILENKFPDVAYANVAYHLRKMYIGGLLTREVINGCVYYSVKTEEIEGITVGYTPIAQTIFRAHDLKHA